MSPEQIALVQAWVEAKQKVEEVKHLMTHEMELRKLVVLSLFSSPKEGTNNLELQGGWTLKYVHKLDYKLDESALTSVQEKLFNMGFASDRLINYTPKLQVKEYRGLDDNIRSIVDEALTIKPSSPTLELVAPK